MRAMRSHYVPVLLLFLVAPFFAETVASTNTPFVIFLNPAVLLFLGLLYGSAAILIRELWVRGKVNLPRFLWLGAAFAALNEGVIANTWFKQNALHFSNAALGRAYGVNWQLLCGLILYHTLYSLLLPLLLVHLSFPKINHEPWLKRGGHLLFAGLLLLVGLGSVLPNKQTHHQLPPNFPERFGLLVLVIAICLVVASLPAVRTKAAPGIKRPFANYAVFFGALAYSFGFALIYFVLPKVLPSTSIILTVVYYVATVGLGRAWWGRRWTARSYVELYAGLLVLAIPVAIAKAALLQPLALVIFGFYLLYVYRQQRRTAALHP